MSFLSSLFFGFLFTYLTFSNSLATGVSTWLEPQPEPDVASEKSDQDSFFTLLPSRLSAIPDILLQSAAYQQAAVGGAVGLTGPTATDPIDSLVNIFCTFRTPQSVRTTTGTGFFIDPDGVIMTNAHVAQFLLLAAAEPAGEANCAVRTGNPATPAYTASLLYIPPAWVQDNAAVMNDEVPMGTGERDYALLLVTRTLNGEPLPAMFPALSHSSALLSTRMRNNAVVAAGYPAGALLRNGSNTDLIPQKADTSVSELYTFGSNRADVFAIRGSVVGAEGASGGPVLNEEGDVIGMIVTRGDDAVDGAGSLRAITLSHVDRTILEETGFTLEEHLDGDLTLRSQVFAETLTPFLLAILQSGQQ